MARLVAARAREADRLLGLAREAKLTGPEADTWAERLWPERARIGEAADWLAANDRLDAAVELIGATWRLWLLRGEIANGRSILGSTLDRAQTGAATGIRARALYGAGLLAFRAGDQAESKARNEQALAVAREIGDTSAEALALVGLSRVAFRDGDYGRVCALAREARDLVVDLDPAEGVAPLHMLAAGTRLAGDYERARELYTESLMLNERLGSTGMISVELHNLAYVNLHRGDVGAAEECFAACSELRSNSGDPYDTAMEALNHAALSFAHGDPDATARLLAEARATLDDAGIQLDPDDRFEVDWLGAQLARA